MSNCGSLAIDTTETAECSPALSFREEAAEAPGCGDVWPWRKSDSDIVGSRSSVGVNVGDGGGRKLSSPVRFTYA